MASASRRELLLAIGDLDASCVIMRIAEFVGVPFGPDLTLCRKAATNVQKRDEAELNGSADGGGSAVFAAAAALGAATSAQALVPLPME